MTISAQSALMYGPISAATAGFFFVVASALGYPASAAGGGAAWTLLLSLIITMPLVTSAVKRQRERG